MKPKYELILEKAYQHLAKNGYDNTSLKNIAKSIGITKPAIYYYFNSKEELFVTLLNYIIEEFENDFKNILNNLKKIKTKEEFIIFLKNIVINDMEKLEKDKNISIVLKQYYLLGYRISEIKENLDNLSLINESKYYKIFEKAHDLDILKKEEIKETSIIFNMIDSSIIENYTENPNYDYKKIWNNLIEKYFE